MSELIDLLTTALNAPTSLIIAAIAGVMVMGISKGGFASPLGIMAVPVMTMGMAPLQATAILLPLLIAMDVFAVIAYWKSGDRAALRVLIPAGILGVFMGWMLASIVTSDSVKLLIGLNAVIYVLAYWFTDLKNRPARAHRFQDAAFWGTISGFTSFISHAGALPAQMYLLPRKLNPSVMVAIATKTIAVVNIAKIAPYFALGQFNTSTIGLSLLLLPLAPLAVFIGLILVRRLPVEKFYTILHWVLFLMGAKLAWDGASEIWF